MHMPLDIISPMTFVVLLSLFSFLAWVFFYRGMTHFELYDPRRLTGHCLAEATSYLLTYVSEPAQLGLVQSFERRLLHIKRCNLTIKAPNLSGLPAWLLVVYLSSGQKLSGKSWMRYEGKKEREVINLSVWCECEWGELGSTDWLTDWLRDIFSSGLLVALR